MAISNIPTFSDGELLTASKLNQLGSAISTKFSGAVSGADLVWPLVAQGNIDLNSSYSLTNLRTLWSVVNVAEYDTVADAIAALPSAGGCLFVPPGTVTTDGNELDTSDVLVLGTGRGSILKLTASATSGYLMRTTAGLNNISFASLTIDGNGATGSGQDGIQVRDVDGVVFSNVYFKNFSGEHLVLTHSGTQGNPCENVQIIGCHFEGGSGDHVLMDDVDGVQIIGCNFENPTTKCINGTPSTTASYMRSILVQGCTCSDANNSIYIVGGSGTASDNWRLVRILGNEIVSDAGVAITCGTTTAILKISKVADNIGTGITGNGINCLLTGGEVCDNTFPSVGGSGCDALASASSLFSGNNFAFATTKGIDGSDTTSCRFYDNDLTGATDGLDLDGATTPYQSNNRGVTDTSHAIASWHRRLNTSRSGNGVFATTITIPANTLARSGDGLQMKWWASCASNNGTIVATAKDGSGTVVLGTIVLGTATAGFGWAITTLVGAADAASNTVSNYASGESGDNFFAGRTAASTLDWTTDVTIEFSAESFPGADAVEVDSVSIVAISAEH
jgi:hypothetical protein